jgi:hypothetical protein
MRGRTPSSTMRRRNKGGDLRHPHGSIAAKAD